MSYVNALSYLRPVNWNIVPDPIDLKVRRTVKANNWDENIAALSKDTRSWSNLSEAEKDVTCKVFAGLQLLDSLQSEVGILALLRHVDNPHEASVLAQFHYIESIHTETYSKIFQSLAGASREAQVLEWANTHPFLQKKGWMIEKTYAVNDPLKVRIASLFLEAFLFYSGFYWPFHLLCKGQLTETASLIKLILRDEAIHAGYIGYKFRKEKEKLTPEQVKEIEVYILTLLLDLYENEVKYTEDLYYSVGLESEVKSFLCLNLNKTLMHLGMAPFFSDEECQVNPAVKTAVEASEQSLATHDFFSVSGTAYFMAVRVRSTDETYQ